MRPYYVFEYDRLQILTIITAIGGIGLALYIPFAAYGIRSKK